VGGGGPGGPAARCVAGCNPGPAAVLQYGGTPPYQETQAYVRAILDLAASWSTTPGLIGGGIGPAPLPGGGQVELTGNTVIDSAVAWATAPIGSWYHYGGRCPDPCRTAPAGHGDRTST